MVIISMRKDLITRITNFFKWTILLFTSKDGGLIPVETEMDIWHNDGCKYWRKKKYEKAIELFSKMIEYDKGDFLGYERLGAVYKETGEIDKAIENYKIALNNAKERAREHPDWFDKSIFENIEKELKELSNANPVKVKL